MLRSAASCLEANAASLRSGSRQPAEPNSSDPVHSAALTALQSKQAGEDAQLAWIEACQASEVPVQTLRALADECQRQEERLQEEICSLDEELLEAYSALQKEPYHLFGIWVHQGQQAEARAGHYVAFLKDWRQDRWLRFSDSFVSTVSWEEVRRAALGGEGQSDAATQKSRSSAYVLVYMEAKLAESQQDADKDIEIPGELLEEIQKDNRALENERGSWEEQVKAGPLGLGRGLGAGDGSLLPGRSVSSDSTRKPSSKNTRCFCTTGNPRSLWEMPLAIPTRRTPTIGSSSTIPCRGSTTSRRF